MAFDAGFYVFFGRLFCALFFLFFFFSLLLFSLSFLFPFRFDKLLFRAFVPAYDRFFFLVLGWFERFFFSIVDSLSCRASLRIRSAYSVDLINSLKIARGAIVLRCKYEILYQRKEEKMTKTDKGACVLRSICQQSEINNFDWKSYFKKFGIYKSMEK